MEKTVGERALIQRINRRIGTFEKGEWPEGERLRKNRSARWWSDLGDFYTVDLGSSFVRRTHLDLEEYGREVGALHVNEKLETS